MDCDIYLSDRYNLIHVIDKSFRYAKVCHIVPQGSVLGLILFTLYILPFGNIIRNQAIHFHCYTDDTQIIVAYETHQLVNLQTCLKVIKT